MATHNVPALTPAPGTLRANEGRRVSGTFFARNTDCAQGWCHGQGEGTCPSPHRRGRFLRCVDMPVVGTIVNAITLLDANRQRVGSVWGVLLDSGEFLHIYSLGAWGRTLNADAPLVFENRSRRFSRGTYDQSYALTLVEG